MKLISEETYQNIKTLTEDVNGKKNYYIEGIFAQANIPNRNGRIYPLDILSREVDRYVSERVLRHNAVGELGHPDGPKLNEDRVSHLIESLKQNGNDFIGKARVLITQDKGKAVAGFIEEGVQLGVSTRGLGSVQENGNGIDIVQDDFHLVTVDVVFDPSAPSAFVRGLYEGKEWLWNNGVLTECVVSTIKQNIDKTPKKFQEEAILENFQKYMNLLSK